MKLNWAERWAVNNPIRILEQRVEVGWVKPRVDLAPGFVGLEMGCGRGAGAAVLLDELDPGRLYAFDLDPEMIRKAERFLSPPHRARVELFVGDSERLPLRDASVDAVFGFGVLHHLPDWRRALDEIRRVLRTGGTYVLEELYPTLYQNFVTRHLLLHPTENRFRREELRAALDEAGLPVADSREIPGIGILAVCTRRG
ncbi:MAG: class I SAM-dependent methyltransferase [Deltaproteobacteria bacterium]|nr:class I SAM-dependent methyltransferase [Deltaproteobacteria bacterium]